MLEAASTAMGNMLVSSDLFPMSLSGTTGCQGKRGQDQFHWHETFLRDQHKGTDFGGKFEVIHF